MDSSPTPNGWTVPLVNLSWARRNAARLLVALSAVAVLSACSGGGTKVPAAPTIDASTAAELRAKALSDAAAAFGITDPPEVAVVRETSPFDQVQALVDCMKQAGYNASAHIGAVMVDAGTGSDSPSDLWRKQEQLAMYVCTAQYPLDAIYFAPLTPEQKEAEADYYLDELPACLEGLKNT